MSSSPPPLSKPSQQQDKSESKYPSSRGRRQKPSSVRKENPSHIANDRTSMALVEDVSPGSPFSWRLERRRSSSSSPSRKPPISKPMPTWRLEGPISSSPRKRSHGIAPKRFHTKTDDEPSVPVWKESIERNMLIQQQKAHTGQLETRRKEFRRITQLKTWPLQDMAMEHLDHLLGANASRQFHGGDYLSAESSSSLSSIESSKPRLAQKSKPKNVENNCEEINENDKTDRNDDNAEIEFQQQKQQQYASPLWSLEPRIFATEKGAGKRKYLVGEFGRIADWYWRKTSPASRHLYEVIREGSPCRLYFDLEYSKADNHAVPEVRVLRELEDELATEIHSYFGKFLPRLRSSQIVNLDSTNEKKFSRHWIVHLLDNKGQEFLFKDAPTVGRFVKRMVGRLAEDMAAEGGDFAARRPALARHLFVNTKDFHKKTCIIDLGVYTRNRLFRCLGSSKKGKSTRLEVVFRETFREEDEKHAKSEEKNENNNDSENNDSAGNEKHSTTEQSEMGGVRCYFPLSMAPTKEMNEPSLSQTSNAMSSINDFIVANDWEPHAQALADSLVVPLKCSLSPSTQEDEETSNSRVLEVEDSYASHTISQCVNGSKNTNFTQRSKFHPTIPMARKGTPMPSLDRYVSESLASRGGVRGSIRAWSIEYGYRDTPVSVTYQIQRNRYCEMIGRPHKSNNVFWTVDLGSWTCLQGCHDPECFGRGSPVPIPSSTTTEGGAVTLETIKQEFETWQDDEFEKALVDLNLDDIMVAATKEPPPPVASMEARGKSRSSPTAKDAEDGYISDEALLQAIVENPKMFP